MQTHQVTLAAGGFARVIGENYNADPVTGLVIYDQFGNTVQSFAPGVWTAIQIINPSVGAVSGAATVLVQDEGL